jgi:hypothetical protein
LISISVVTSDAIFYERRMLPRWNRTQFQTFTKSRFLIVEGLELLRRSGHIFFDKSGQTAWFDELPLK